MFSSNFNAVRNAVCSVSSDLGVGTGWLYRRTNNTVADKTIYVVTASHIVVERNNGVDTIYDPSVLINNVNNSGNNQIFQTKVISVDRKGDIALLEIQNHRGVGNKYPLNWPNHVTLNVNSNIPSIGSPIFIVGYPLGWDYNSFSGGYLRENNASDYFTPTSLYYNLAISSGNSGSPVFNTSNQVIGMLQWGLDSGDELNGGIRGDILYYFLETSIASFIQSGRTSYKSIFKKRYIGFFGNDNQTSFIPLSAELIKMFNDFDMANAYKNGGRNVNGILMLYNNTLTNLVLERVTYTDYRNVTKTIVLSSSVYDKNSIWEILYFGRSNYVVTLNFYNLETNATFLTNIVLQDELPYELDFFLTEGLSKREVYNNLISKVKNKDDIKEVKDPKDTKETIINNTNLLIEKINRNI